MAGEAVRFDLRGESVYPPDVIEALKDALRSIYWYKRQLKSFLINCNIPPTIVQSQSWSDPQEYKAIIVDKVINSLIAMGNQGLGPMRQLIKRTIEMTDFSHLE